MVHLDSRQVEYGRLYTGRLRSLRRFTHLYTFLLLHGSVKVPWRATPF